VQRMIRWTCKVKSDAEVLDVVENATLDTDPIESDGVAESRAIDDLVQDREPWQQRLMRKAWARGWRPDADADARKAARAYVTGWVPPAERPHWCPRCRDKQWCRLPREDANFQWGRCANPAYRPQNSTYRATVDALWVLSVADLMKVINLDTDLTQAEIRSLNALEDFIMTGLRRAGVLAEDDEDGYTEGQLVEGLDEVRVAMTRGVERSTFKDDILATITRAMNAE
jgi:hypothetical protein